jgi:hypothetical protein
MTGSPILQRMRGRTKFLLKATLAGLFMLAVAVASYLIGRKPGRLPEPGERTTSRVVKEIHADVARRLGTAFLERDLQWPFRGDVALLAFKDQRVLQVYARPQDGAEWRFIKQYPILAASGFLGPKLREGDRQVPEGLYEVEYLNPNSRFYLSFKINYPNEWDWARAREEGRDQPGSNIFIHGKAQSIGCLAMGDPAAEDLFSLVATAGKENVRVIIAPTDFRVEPVMTPRALEVQAARAGEQPVWVAELYDQIRAALEPFPPRSSGMERE